MRRFAGWTGCGAVSAALVLGLACSGDDGAGGGFGAFGPGIVDPGPGTDDDDGPGFTTGPSGGCTGLECQQVQCPSPGETTTVTGTVFDPSGSLPLYNALVFVPNAPLDDIPEGASCDPCGYVSGSPVVSAITDTEGKFTLTDVPVGDDIPIVIQLGKWRREITLPSVEACSETPISDSEQTSLPSNKSEGHIPRIALATGGADALECLLRKIGLDPEEFTLSSDDGRINLYAGNGGSQSYSGGAALEPAQPFWSSLDTLMPYDIVLLACEGAQFEDDKPTGARQAMQQYADAGGRMFLSHWHNVWLEQGPAPWPDTAEWDFQDDPPMPYTGLVDQSFPKGIALADWLVNVEASTVLGELPISAPQHTLNGVDGTMAQQWITGLSPDAGSVKYFTFNTPIGADEDELCGRVVFSDIHVSSGDTVGEPFPDGCTTSGLTPQEKALVFMLFDLSSCIQPDEDPPLPPVQ